MSTNDLVSHDKPRKLRPIVVILFWATAFISAAGSDFTIFFCLLLTVPWIALVAVALAPDQIAIDFANRRTPTPPLLPVAILSPGFWLFTEAKYREVMTILPLILRGAFIALIFTILFIWINRKLKGSKWNVFAVAVMSTIYGMGCADAINYRFDDSSGEIQRVGLIRKTVLNSARENYSAKVEAWGRRPEQNDVTIPKSIFDAVDPGSQICLRVHPGAIGVPWFLAEPCENK